MKKLSTSLLALIAMIGLLNSNSVSADIVNLGNNAPMADIVDSETIRNSFTRAFTFAANANHGRGNVFSTGSNTVGGTQFEITSITVSKDVTQTFNMATLDLFLWQGAASDWTSGNGATANTAADIYGNTSVTPLAQETSVLDGTFSANDYIRIELASPVIVSENSDFGFLLTYTDGTGDPTFLQLDERNGAGGQTRLTNTTNDINGSRALTFYAEGTALSAVPEPTSTMILGLGALGLCVIRRKR